MKEPGDRYHLGIDWYAGLEYLGSLGIGRRSVLVVSVEREPGRGEVVAITRPGGLGAGLVAWAPARPDEWPRWADPGVVLPT